MSKIHLIYRIDIGFNADRGYGAAILDTQDKKTKGIRANSMRQLMRRVHEAVCDDEQRKRRFPLESEAMSAPSIITPESGDPLFNGNGI